MLMSDGRISSVSDVNFYLYLKLREATFKCELCLSVFGTQTQVAMYLTNPLLEKLQNYISNIEKYAV